MIHANNEVVLKSKAIREDKGVCFDRMVGILCDIIRFHGYCLQCVIYIYWNTVDERPPSISISNVCFHRETVNQNVVILSLIQTRPEVHLAECGTRCVKHRLVFLWNKKAKSFLNISLLHLPKFGG